MKYIKGSARYDIETRNMLGNFLTFKNIKHKFQPIGKYFKNICWLNEARRKVTKDCCDRFVENKQSCEINFKYKSQIEKYNVCVGMPVICTVNMKKRNMFNMMEFTIDEMLDTAPFSFTENYDDSKIISSKLIMRNLIKTSFEAVFYQISVTQFTKYQGGKIDKHYNIYDTHKMDVKEMYTCLSRTTKLEYIHLDSNKKQRWYRKREQANMVIVNSYFNDDYQNSKIYQITFEKNNKIYVQIDLMTLFPCKDKKTLDKIINEYKQKYGDELLNIKGVKRR